MLFRTAYAQSTESNAAANSRQAVRKLKHAMEGFSASMLIYFAATDYDPHILAVEMRDAFPGVVTFGCTTAGEGVDGKLLNASVVAMAYAGEVFDYCETALVLGNGQPAEGKGVFTTTTDALRHLGRKLDGTLLDLDYREYVGFMLGDHITSHTETVVEKISEQTDIIFVGGIAGDDYKFSGEDYVFYEGKAYKSAAVLALWKPKRGFALLKTQAVDVTDTYLNVTKVSEDQRAILEIDGRDAAGAYAAAIGVPVETMDTIDFDEHPLAVTADGDPYLRVVTQREGENGLKLFARVYDGTRMNVTRAGDIVGSTRRALDDKLAEFGNVSAILHVNCVSRHTTLKNKNQTDEFAALFKDLPNIAFSSYGEIYVGIVAMTSTMILFK